MQTVQGGVPAFEPPEFNEPTFTAPGQFEYPDFIGPTGEEVRTSDPGYGFREQQGLRAIQNAAAAQGLLRSTGTVKSLADYASGLASQEYGNAWNRGFTGWQANRGAAAEDYDRLWRNALTEYTLGYQKEADEFNRALSEYGVNQAGAAQAYGFGLDVAAGAAGGRQVAGTQQLNLAMAYPQYLLADQQQRWGNLLDLYKISRPDMPYTPAPPYNPQGFTG